MAADILLYDADYVPVGIDQQQHIEIARDIANRFNNRYGETFKLPEGLYPEGASKVMDLQDPNKKMSKSAVSTLGVVFLLDEEKDIVKKIKSAVTDSNNLIAYDPEQRPAISNLVTIYSAFADMDQSETVKKFAGVQYGTFKKELAELVVDSLRPIQQKYKEFASSNELENMLNSGRDRSSEIAKSKYEEAKTKIGYYR
jgi:tryptophanyl-tRNA synthetase